MNRADLAWALTATLPHAKDSVVLESSPTGTQLYVWATDRYSAGVASIDCATPFSVPFLCALSASEARDLLKETRPARVAQQAETVAFLGQTGELHVGFNTESFVFDSIVETPKPLSDALLPLFRHIWMQPKESAEWVYHPPLFARFAKALRGQWDRMYLHPRSGELSHAALVTVGEHFIGAIKGMTYGNPQMSPPILEVLAQ